MRTASVGESGVAGLVPAPMAALGAMPVDEADSGAGGLTVSSGGTHTLSGTLANTYTGATTVNGGTLVLQKTPDILGDLGRRSASHERRQFTARE